MKMSANENETEFIQFYANRRPNLLLQIDLEELNRMERPSRVFSSRHHLSMPPVLTDVNNMEQNDQLHRSRDYSSYFENTSSSSRIGGSTANGEAIRNRSPFVRFTITDPDTQQITAAGQIPLNNTPPNTQTSSLTSNNEVADLSINDESDDEPLNLNFWRSNTEQIRSVDHFGTMAHASQQLRNSRSGRRSRRFTEHPYFIRNNLDNNTSISNSRTYFRRVRFLSSSRGHNDHALERSQTPEQELPEVLEHVTEPDNQYDEDYQGQESISSISSHNDANSSDEHFSVTENHHTNADDENRDDTLSVSYEIPRNRVVPFIMSPTPISPSPESPPDTPEIPALRVNNDLLDVPRTLPLVTNNDDNDDNIFSNPSRTTEEIASVRVEEHPETYEDLSDQLIRLFECPVCFEHIVPPIFQCLLGHLICNKCVLMCANCPTCRNPFNSKRNLYMEKVGYLVKFPCRNALTGCKQQMFVGQKEVHEQECCYRHYQCFFTNCAWKGYYPELHSHMISNHSSDILTGSEQTFDIMLPHFNHKTYKWFLLSHSEYFAVIAHSSIPPRRVKIQVNFIGPAVKAKQFKFSVLLTQHLQFNDMSQKLMYERSTLPYSEIYEMSNNNGLKKDIFSVPGEMLEPFLKKRRRLPIILKVSPTSS
ncbi:uncharacterized protein LOC112601353 isoform X4 [Melanaphis sacchari]|uniref:uncharacterized protein LOC112601353 isoform X4 n=1 Tax=Melanaphis sacchari TaxID=742174 RepID=UPI000DC14FDD|nr:uncharacterized protein LOC112601353 isoform X4 [Melanaphis sacchari]